MQHKRKSGSRTQCPPIDGTSVPLSEQYLRCKVVRRAYEAEALAGASAGGAGIIGIDLARARVLRVG